MTDNATVEVVEQVATVVEAAAPPPVTEVVEQVVVVVEHVAISEPTSVLVNEVTEQVVVEERVSLVTVQTVAPAVDITTVETVHVVEAGIQGVRGPVGPAGPQNLYIQADQPDDDSPYLWVETGLGLGDDYTLWFETGGP